MTQDDEALVVALRSRSQGGGPRTAGATDRPRSPGRPMRGETGPVINRIMKVLSVFSRDHPALTVSELSRRAGIPLTTVHRLAGSLQACGILERRQSGHYQIGLRVWELASLAPRGLGLREIAFPFMEDVFLVTRQHVQLAVREGHDSVFVERITGRDAVPVLNNIGGRFPLHPSGVGRVLLAHAPGEVQDEVLAGPLKRYTPHTVTSPPALRRILADVREQGFAVNDRQITADSVSVAVPVRGPEGGVVAALALIVPLGYASPGALVPLLQTAARAISRGLSAETFPLDGMTG